ncbi:MAG: class II aldolase/adducin family protein [Woeseiaceae bacterium]|nr:class II aldolase/adducin family protein [Woeseiaceae bacterium]
MIDEGYIKFELDWVEGPPPDSAAIAELRRWRRPLYEAGLIGHYDDLGIGFGNLSVRSRGEGHFVISGTQTGHLADPDERHYALVTDYDIDANRVTCRGRTRASSESMTHAALYELSPAINAVAHVHSLSLWRRLRDVLPTTAADIAYGTPQMAREFRRLFEETDFGRDGIAVMAGHEEGIVATGGDLRQAARRILDLPERG